MCIFYHDSSLGDRPFSERCQTLEEGSQRAAAGGFTTFSHAVKVAYEAAREAIVIKSQVGSKQANTKY